MPRKLPKIGQDIYLPEAVVSKDMKFGGGLCKIISFEMLRINETKQKSGHFVTVAERPAFRYNWNDYVVRGQKEWGPKYGNRRDKRIGNKGIEGYEKPGCDGSCDCKHS